MAIAMLAGSASADVPIKLTLAEAVRVAASESPGARIGVLRSEQADRRVGQARGALLPAVDGTAFGANRTINFKAQGFPLPPGFPDVFGPVDNVDARVHVRQAVVDLPAFQRWQAAGLGAAVGRADRDSSAESAARAAALAWLRAARSEARVDARRRDLALATELLQLAREQHAAGVSPAIDTTRAGTARAASRGELLEAEVERDRTRLELARALGIDPKRPPEPADSLTDRTALTDAPAEESAAFALARKQRPELAASLSRLERSRAEKRATSFERLPRLEAAADWGLSGQHTTDWQGTRSYSLGLTLPILDGGERGARIAEQDAVVREEAERDHDRQDQVVAEVRAALYDLSSNHEQLEVAAERLSLAEQELDQARERFTSGIAGNIEVIEAQVSLLRARDADIDARFALASARVALAHAVGVARGLH